tara:strand:- start:769 stop:1035 length:267 start_codon:yes stop_codon:yes gene_type:complete
MIEIEKNIPLPPKGKKGRHLKYQHFDEIIKNWQVGDSIAFAHKPKKNEKHARPPREMTAFLGRARTAGQKVATRSVSAEGVMRVWRIE